MAKNIKGLDDSRGGLALHVGAGQVGGVVADNLRQTYLVVGVVGDGLSAGVHLAGHGEQRQRREFRVLNVVVPGYPEGGVCPVSDRLPEQQNRMERR